MGVEDGFGFGVAVGTEVGVGVGVGGGSVGGSDGSIEGVALGTSVGLAVGQGSDTGSEPDGDGRTNDGTTPSGSGVGCAKHDGDGAGAQLPPTRAPHEDPYGWNPVV